MIKKELSVFLIVGGLTVLIDFLVYRALFSWSALDVDAAKAVGFMAGTVFAYAANRLWTFGHATHWAGSLWRFALLYSTTLAANVLVNGLVLTHAPFAQHAVQAAFLVATGLSAAMNFLGMKFFVFRPQAPGKSS